MPMDTLTLRSILESERTNAIGVNLSDNFTVNTSRTSHTKDTLSNQRATALDYYLGDMHDMPAEDGTSTVQSTDVRDTIEGVMPVLMDIFASTNEVVRFSPVGPEDVDGAEQETDYVNHVFWESNPGFLILYTMFKDALISKSGIVKCFWEEEERSERETYHDQDDDTFVFLTSQPDIKLVEHSEEEGPYGKIHSFTIEKTSKYGCAKVVNVPPEEFRISRSARSILEAKYCSHERNDKTQSDLIDEGYDSKQVEDLPTSTHITNSEELSRNTTSDEMNISDTLNRASRPIRVIEHYCVLDYEGKGKSALYRITTGGDSLEVLKRNGKEEIVRVDCMPFASITPIIMPHRFLGLSLADLVMDIQKIKTALLRGLLNNVYMVNNQRLEVPESHAGENTIDDIINNKIGGMIRTKTPGGLNPIPNQNIGDFIYPALEYMDSIKENRSGVQRQGQALDANALVNETATKVNQVFSAAQAKIKLIARIFAETGIKDLFILLHGVIRKNDRKQNTVRLRGKWVNVDPSDWKKRNDMTISVGLGDGSKQDQIQSLMMILSMQKEAIQAPQLGLVTPKNIYNTATKIVEKVGLKNVEPYFTDPDTVPPEAKQPPPDPRMAELEMKAQIEKLQAQADIETQNKKIEAEIAQSQAEFEFKKQLEFIKLEVLQQKEQTMLERDLVERSRDMQMTQFERMNKIAQENASKNEEQA